MKEKTKNDSVASEEEVKEAAEAPEAEKEKKEKKKEKLSETDKLKAELKDKEDQYLRLYAEYDNFRKRSQKEKSDIYSSSRADVISDLLPILDNFDRAAANAEADFDGYKKGIELIFNQFLQLLEKNGVETFGEVGEEFDPNIHTAVMTTQNDELGENTIAQVFSKGYKLGEKIIRPATVVVANT